MNICIDLIRLFFLQAKIKFSRSIMYRTDFFLGIFISLCFSSLAPLFQYLLFVKTKGYPGWSYFEVILFQGVLLFWFGLRDTLFGGIRPLINDLVWKGELDRILVKPYPAIGILLSSGFNYYGLGSIIAGITIMFYATLKLQITYSVINILNFLLFIFFGLILYMAVTVIYCTVIVIIVFAGRTGEIFDKLLRFAEFPVVIYSGIIRFTMLTFIPFAIWVNFPTSALLGKLPVTAYLSLLFCLIFFGLSIGFWNLKMRKYKSAGG